MRKDFLEDYEKKEIGRQRNHYKFAQFFFGTGYPPASRFNKKPMVLGDTTTYASYGEKIWSQVPFAGTLIVPLGVSTRERFLSVNCFDIEDIPHLISLAKERGNVQFCIDTLPTRYIEMDYLEPIFRELQPPLLSVPLEGFKVDSTTAEEWDNEFDVIASPLFNTDLMHDVEKIKETEQYRMSAWSYYQSITVWNKMKSKDLLYDVGALYQGCHVTSWGLNSDAWMFSKSFLLVAVQEYTLKSQRKEKLGQEIQ